MNLYIYAKLTLEYLFTNNKTYYISMLGDCTSAYLYSENTIKL